MSAPGFTILLPVHRPPALLPYAIASVQTQERQDFELFVICDGAPPETAAFARERAAVDLRIRVFEHPKGERNGEIYRHQALQEARGEHVCQISDDDLWLPNHLTEMTMLMRSVDFGHISMVWILPNQKARVDLRSLADPSIRQRMLSESWNFFGPTTVGYRLSAYKRLPQGWSPAPRGMHSDLFMWRKFLAQPDISAGSRIAVTSAHLAAAQRQDRSLKEREAEIRLWSERLADPMFRDAFVQAALANAIRSDARKHVPRPTSWRLARPLRAIARRLGWRPS